MDYSAKIGALSAGIERFLRAHPEIELPDLQGEVGSSHACMQHVKTQMGAYQWMNRGGLFLPDDDRDEDFNVAFVFAVRRIQLERAGV